MKQSHYMSRMASTDSTLSNEPSTPREGPRDALESESDTQSISNSETGSFMVNPAFRVGGPVVGKAPADTTSTIYRAPGAGDDSPEGGLRAVASDSEIDPIRVSDELLFFQWWLCLTLIVKYKQLS